jgi:hypothetical protein
MRGLMRRRCEARAGGGQAGSCCATAPTALMATSTQSFQFANIAANGAGFIVKGGIRRT